MTSVAAKILVVDDDATIRFAIREFLEFKGFEVLEAATCGETRQTLSHSQPDAAIVNYSLPDGDALKLLAAMKAHNALVPTVILTAHGSIDLAVRAIKEGAEQFLTKPVELATLLVVLNRMLENRRKERLISGEHAARRPQDPFLGTSKAIQQISEQCTIVANSDLPVVLSGETGTGKGVLASWMHKHSRRKDESFVDINCAGLSQELLESELFGHEKGAFTGAITQKPGLLEFSNRGTLFLDEIGDMHSVVQQKLLKVLEEKQFRRLGEVRSRQVNFRLIAATHRNLATLVNQGEFRSDLFFRINSVEIKVPPLRERIEDIPAIAKYLLDGISSEIARGERKLTTDAIEVLTKYRWPGNIRELRNVLERAVLLSGHSHIAAADLRLHECFPQSHPILASVQDGGFSSAEDPHLSLEEVERLHIAKVLKSMRGNMSQTAKVLGISKSTLYFKLKTHAMLHKEATESQEIA